MQHPYKMTLLCSSEEFSIIDWISSCQSINCTFSQQLIRSWDPGNIAWTFMYISAMNRPYLRVNLGDVSIKGKEDVFVAVYGPAQSCE